MCAYTFGMGESIEQLAMKVAQAHAAEVKAMGEYERARDAKYAAEDRHKAATAERKTAEAALLVAATRMAQ